MPSIIDHETMNIDKLPGVWVPIQWELSEPERLRELEQQATASLLWSVDVPEAILRLLLSETQIERADGPPPGYDPEQQGEWDPGLLTFTFRRPITLESVDRSPERLVAIYRFGELGYWEVAIEPQRVTIERI